MPSPQACCEVEPDGTLIVEFRIEATGRVSQADVHTSTLGSAAVEQCVRDHFVTLQFPQPTGGDIVTVSLPLQFHPS